MTFRTYFRKKQKVREQVRPLCLEKVNSVNSIHRLFVVTSFSWNIPLYFSLYKDVGENWQNRSFDWTEYLRKTGAKAAPTHYFEHVSLNWICWLRCSWMSDKCPVWDNQRTSCTFEGLMRGNAINWSSLRSREGCSFFL